MKKNLLTFLLSIFFSIFILYIGFFVVIYFKNYSNDPNLFRSINKLEFHKNYSKKLHHLRGKYWPHEKHKMLNIPEDYLFSIINKYSNNSDNILLQGDSWIERTIFLKKPSDLINNFVKKKKIGYINSGISSFSPSLMQIQYEILEKDFQIKPNIIFAYIDQTDIGDEICRYKEKRIFDKNNTLIAVKNENYSNAVFDYTKVYNISEILLLNNSKIRRSYKLVNFYFKYGFLIIAKKLKSIKKYGWEKRNIYKCKFAEIKKYLLESGESDIVYFEKRVIDYINFLKNKKYIEKIFLVTFPHHNHIFKYENKKDNYSINVSNIIDKIIKSEEKIYHINFSKLILDRDIDLKYNLFQENDPASHLREDYHANIFIQEIISTLENLR